MAVNGIDTSRVSPVMAPTLIEQEKEQPKIALPSQLPQQNRTLQPIDSGSAKVEATRELEAAKSKLDLITKNIQDESVRSLLKSVQGNYDRARHAVDALSFAAAPTYRGEQLAADQRKQVHNLINEAQAHVDPLLNVNASSLQMAKAVGEIMNQHSMRLDQNTAQVQQLTELRGMLEHHKHLDKAEFSELPERLQQLLGVAREAGVLWPENEGWNDARERDARIQGIEFATQSLSKTGEQLTLRLQFAQNTYNQHLMNAAYAIQRQAKIIELILQLLGRS